MKTSEVLSIYGSQRAVADALYECSQAAVAQWGDEPPPLRQLELENLNPKRLTASPRCDRYRVRSLKPHRAANGRQSPAPAPTDTKGA